MTAQLVIAGGRGLAMFEGAEVLADYPPQALENPYGVPSGRIWLVRWLGATFYCFSRHGDQQQLAPAEIPYLANAFALKQLGVKYWLAISLSTGLKGAPRPGDVVVADDYVSIGVNRLDQFFSEHTQPGLVLYADNYKTSVSGILKQALRKAAEGAGIALMVNPHAHPDNIPASELIVYAGTSGPQTGTYAEERLLTAVFQNVVGGMTNMTEALVCRQSGIEFAGVSFIGGLGMNYGGIGESIASLDAKVIPILRQFVREPLPPAPSRSLEAFLSLCTGGDKVAGYLKAEKELAPAEQRLANIVKVLAP